MATNSIDSLFQIVGAACFCAPSPFGPAGYLATTVLEVMFGGSESNPFFSALDSVLNELAQSIQELKTLEIESDLLGIQTAVKDYTNAIRDKWNQLLADAEPPYDFFVDRLNPGADLIHILEYHEGKLLAAVDSAEAMWGQRSLYDRDGSFGLYSYYLLAITAHLSCHRQLGSAYATVANLVADTNHADLISRPMEDGLGAAGSAHHSGFVAGAMSGVRPEPRVLLLPGESPKEASVEDFLHWTSQHWRQVNSHRKLVADAYVWPKDGARTLDNARLDGASSGYYNRLWFECVELWRRAESSLSMPAEIYRWMARDYWSRDATSYGFAHGWLTSHFQKSGFIADDYSDLLPPAGGSNLPGSRVWLDDWLKEMKDLCPAIKMAHLSSTTPAVITGEDQKVFLQHFRGIFGIGFFDARCTLYLLRRLRKELQAWRLQQAVDTEIGKLHAAAWPTTGELSALVARLDETIPCSWERGANYLPSVLASLEARWNDMAGNSGAGTHLNPAPLVWMQGVTCWWKDRSSADQAPMPLLPETIALILEVWLAAAIRADQLQRPLRVSNGFWADAFYKLTTEKAVIAYDANEDLQRPQEEQIAYSLPAGLSVSSDRNEDNNKNYYDQHREQIRKAWKRKRQAKLDELLQANYGLKPSQRQPSPSESIAQAWIDGLIDLSDNLPLQKPDQAITEIQSQPGLQPPAGLECWWKQGNQVRYSYQLRSLSAFKPTGSDQTSEESELSKAITLNDDNVIGAYSPTAGIVVKIPRDRLMLARQFTLWRTVTDTSNLDPKTNTLKKWIGSGSFSPGQTEPSVFHDGTLARPAALNAAAISPASREIRPPAASHWLAGHHVQYQLVFFDCHGTGSPSPPSPFSEPYPIDPQHGLMVSIPVATAGLATQAQLNRRIVRLTDDGSIAVVDPLKAIAKGSFPVAVDQSIQMLTLIDGITAPLPGPVVFSLHMSKKGLDLRRSDQPLSPPVWSTYGNTSPAVTMAMQQGDGNLVLYDETRSPRWASNTMEWAGQTNSRRALRLKANGELAIVASVDHDQLVPNGVLFAGDPALFCDRPAVFLRSGELMLPGQVLSIDNQAPAVNLELTDCAEP